MTFLINNRAGKFHFILDAVTTIFYPLSGTTGSTTTNNALSHLFGKKNVVLESIIEMNNPLSADNPTTVNLVDSAGVDIPLHDYLFPILDSSAKQYELGIWAPQPNFGARLTQTGASFRKVMITYSILD